MSNYSNPWKTLSSREVYKNHWLRLREDQVVRPDGRLGIYSVIETRIATGVIAITPQCEVYLVGQYRYPTDSYSWEIPEGGTDDNELPLDAIKRELREEAGLTARNWVELCRPLHLSNCISSEVARLYVATGLEETEHEPDGTEVLQVRVAPFAECLEMLERGEITDAMTVIALLTLDRRTRAHGWARYLDR